MTEREMWNAACELVMAHGADGALAVAARRAETFRAKGDFRQSYLWSHIVERIAEITRPIAKDEALH